MVEQPTTCDNCGGTNKSGLLDADHDHATGYVRGWLCRNCNMGIGLLGDDVAGLERAIEYLRRPLTDVLYADVLRGHKRRWKIDNIVHVRMADAASRRRRYATDPQYRQACLDRSRRARSEY